MKLSYLFISSVVALGSFTSCSDVLDVAPDGTLSMEEVYAAYSGGYPFSISGDIRSVPS